MVRLPNRCSANGLPTFSLHRLLPISIDQLDKADAPLISEAYIYLLGVQYLVSLSDGLTGYSFHLYNTVAVQNPPTGSTEPVCVLCPLDPMTLPEAKPARTGLQTVHAMLNAGWPAHLVTFSFLFTTASDSLLGPRRPADARLPHRVPHSPRGAFLNAPAKAALPRRCARRIATRVICVTPLRLN
jgi:hypothetical protein